jgi:DNA polymerase-3 subunit delta
LKIRPEQLQRTLSSTDPAIYWLAGDEPLLMQESADLIRQHYRHRDFLEREVFNVDKNFDWNQFINATGNLSLFCKLKIIELRLGSARLDDAGKKALHNYVQDPNADLLILILSPKLDAAAIKTKWFTQIEQAGVLLQIWPVPRDKLAGWLSQRLLREDIHADHDAIQLLADKIEGNLLAAVQEIEKLKLLANAAPGTSIKLDVKTVMQVVADSSRYSVYHLVDTALLGDSLRSQKMLSGLRNEGLFPLVVLGAITRELRALLPMLEKKAQGQQLNAIIQSARVWFNRKQAVSKALERMTVTMIWQLLDHARRIDQSIKGLSRANPWDELSLILLALSGSKTATMTKTSAATTRLDLGHL